MHFIFLSGESHGQGSLAGCSPKGRKAPDASLAQPPSWDRSPSPGVLPPYVSAQAPIGSHTSSESNSLVKPYGQNPPLPLSISSPAPPPFRPSLALQLTSQTQSHRHSIQDIVCCTALQVHREAIVLLEVGGTR